MKKGLVITVLVVGLALTNVACKSDSPTGPKPSPTPAAISMTVTKTAAQAKVGDPVYITARLTTGGQTVPDNTSVAFKNLTPSVCSLFSVITLQDPTEMYVTTTGGAASAAVVGVTAGTCVVQVRSGSASVNVATQFVLETDPRVLQIYGVSPNRGSANGGDLITIYGIGFLHNYLIGRDQKNNPLGVFFVVGNSDLQAEIVSVNNTGTSMVVKSPIPPRSPNNSEQLAGIKIVEGVPGTEDSEGKPISVTAILSNAFIYAGTSSDPQIFYVDPNRGRWSGLETVVIVGANFFDPVRVMFGAEEAVITGGDDKKLTVTTPRHTTTSYGEQPVTITVYNRYGTPEQRAVSLPNGFTYLPETGEPMLYSVSPDRGRVSGGETVTLTGRFFTEPVRIELQLGAPIGTTMTAAVTSVVHNPSGTDVLTFVTPKISPTPVLQDVTAAIIITNLVGSPDSKSATFLNRFIFVGDVGQPQAFYCQPNRGSVDGGEEVTIFGRYFIAPVRVRFAVAGEAIVKEVAADGTSVTVLTPPLIGTPPATPVSITITTQADTGRDQSVTLANAFQYTEGEVPELYSLNPNSGPLEGGTRVTIIGKGFQYPLQVIFTIGAGERQAQVVSSNYNQIVCMSPSITPTAPGTPTNAQVSVINTKTGKKSAGSLTFRYGEAMFISGIAPNAGPDYGGTQVIILGQGFSAPVIVTFAGYGAAIKSVSGTEIIATTSAVPPAERTCEVLTGPVVVTNVNSSTTATGPDWNYLPSVPFITSVNPSSITEGTFGMTMTIRGQNFERFTDGTSAMRVIFGANIATAIPTVVDSTTMTLVVPDLSAIPIRTVPCTTATGGTGTRNVATPVDITVLNIITDCQDTLTGGLIIVPLDSTTCSSPPVAPVITLTCPANIPAGSVAAVTCAVTITPQAVRTLGWAAAGTISFNPGGTNPTGTVVTNAFGLGSISLTPAAGSVAGQSTTITLSFPSAANATATITVN